MAEQATWHSELLKELQTQTESNELNNLIMKIRSGMVSEQQAADELNVIGMGYFAGHVLNGTYNTRADTINKENAPMAQIKGEKKPEYEPGREPNPSSDTDTSQGSLESKQVRESKGKVAKDTKATTENTGV